VQKLPWSGLENSSPFEVSDTLDLKKFTKMSIESISTEGIIGQFNAKGVGKSLKTMKNSRNTRELKNSASSSQHSQKR
jgi:hypothetical protein